MIRRFTAKSPVHPPGSDGLVLYAIGDIHGRADLLEAAHQRIDADHCASSGSRKVEICLGDYVDRGPDSARVVQLLLDRARTHEIVPLRGNHEQVLLQFLAEEAGLSDWAPLGGLSTLVSYGVDPRDLRSSEARSIFSAALPREHLAFFMRTWAHCQFGRYLFVHAGIRPGVAIDRQVDADLLWIRDEFLAWRDAFDWVVVHGHTPVEEPELLHNRINIDTGAFITNRLTILRIDERGPMLL